MREIPLTQGKVALVDDGDYEWLMQWKWVAKPDGGDIYYAVRYRTPQKEGVVEQSMHRFILGAKPTEQVDHVDHDGLNNGRSNLRICTRSENKANGRLYKNNQSGFKGVYLTPQGAWRAQIRVGTKLINLGTYNSPVDAALKYDEAACSYFKEFAFTNAQMGKLPLCVS
jgi:hypothetical protein